MPTRISFAAQTAALACIFWCSPAALDAALPSTSASTAPSAAAAKQLTKARSAAAKPQRSSKTNVASADDGARDPEAVEAVATDEAQVQTPVTGKSSPARAEGGSVLRLVSGLEGKEDPATRPLEPLVMPQSYAQTFDPGVATTAGSGRWIDSRMTRQKVASGVDGEVDYGWFEYLPQGIVPIWGPRTPESERCSDWGGTLLHSDKFEACGEPLVGTSWRNRPFGASIYLGVMDGGPLISPYLTQGSGFFGGGRLSWDYDYYWGLETRLGVSYLKLNNSLSPIAPDSTNVFLWDVSMLYYPWGDTRWRPYWIAGLGLASFRYIDQDYNVSANGSFTIPFGMGVKYQLREYLVARMEVLDNWAMSGRTLDTMHNVSGTVSLEFRFGGERKSYWPWYPGSYIK